MGTSDLSFTTLRRLLLDLGFREKTLPSSHLVFSHEPSETLFAFRAYAPHDKVTLADLRLVRSQLDLRGLLGADAFDALLLKVSA